MAQADVGEQEYESDPEELKRSLATRRREASDDEDEDEDDEVVKNRKAEIDFDSAQSDEHADNGGNKSEDGEGSYEDEEEEGDDDGYTDLDEVDDDDGKVSLMKSAEDDDVAGRVDGEEDKEKQSAAVPTGGAFYMHDDRFQELSAGRSRRGRGGRRSWGSGDERKWGHDKYEEMNTLEKPHDQKSSRGGFRGRGRGRGQGRGYSRGRSSNASSSNGHQVFVPKATTRVGEPRKDEIPLSKGSQAHSSKPLRNSRGSQHWHEKKSHHDSRRSPSASAQTGNEDVHTKKNVVVSSLSSASPPFYPSVSSSSLLHGIQAGMERLQTNESATPSGKKLRNTKSVYVPVHTAQTFQPTSQVRGAPSSHRTNSSGNRYPPGEMETALDTGASFAKGKGTLQASGSGSLMYSGSQVTGHAESLASGDNSNLPAFLPVMQFGGQRGGVPTFGMAFPGYVQPENGIGNPEMTWMPVLTGPGALGASYSPPYAAVDGSYATHKPGSSSRENSTNNLGDLENPLERPESGVSKRQNSNSSKQPRRYSEMSFSK
ncbi:Btz domain-containing protein [Hirschfeldia incana]|nr:Btz domain-containing protein [Hirschfeldia incana]KAJ0247972.1 Btz domain-containing protein [Hirschfeldia incana]